MSQQNAHFTKRDLVEITITGLLLVAMFVVSVTVFVCAWKDCQQKGRLIFSEIYGPVCTEKEE